MTGHKLIAPLAVFGALTACAPVDRSQADADSESGGQETDPGSTGAEPTSGGPGQRLDVPPGSTDGCDPTETACGCSGVDILFVVDNSGSMGPHQTALTQAFPQFAEAIVSTLPPGTNVHVGVTSTEMGFESEGGGSACQWGGPGTALDHYETPDVSDTGRNGAQGRLFVPEGQPAFFSVDTDAPQSELDALSTWFDAAARVGTGGSNVEMALAPAGWAFDPANVGTNGGFLRDEGTVLVLFFVQDEPDQTPVDGGVPGDLIDRVAAAKSACGGLDCVVAGGTVAESCLPEVALGQFLDALDPADVNTDTLPFAGTGDPSLFVEVLRENLVALIADKCREIEPVG